jgi:hypothetical protein
MFLPIKLKLENSINNKLKIGWSKMIQKKKKMILSSKII